MHTLDEVVLAALALVIAAVGIPVDEDIVAETFDADRQRRTLSAHRTPHFSIQQRAAISPVKNGRLKRSNKRS